MPVFNGADLVSRAVESAQVQDYPNVEIVVVDDASTDATVQILKSRFGASIDLVTSELNCGHSQAANSAIMRSRGSLIKFLHHDDQLETDCVSKMVGSLMDHGSAGMVFSPRAVEVETETAASREWLARYGDVHLGFSSLGPLNSGLRLLREIVVGGMQNWVGEPSCVMVRRECLERLGGFDPRIPQLHDLELWLRIMSSYDVAFVDEELMTYRHSPTSLTGTVRGAKGDWLDQLWILENLMSREEVLCEVPEIKSMWRAERRMAIRTAVRHAVRPASGDPPMGPWRAYVGHRVRRRLGRPDLIGRV
jgi:glycosyltransferase involved in cell wall biosynthesis